MYTYIVIDDEPLIRKGTIKKLEGFPELTCVAQASNGQTALTLIEEHDPDLIITDMKMPIMDGTQLLPVLSSQYPQKFIIVISGYKDFEYVQQALQANSIDYLVKPFSKDSLWKSVEKAICQLQAKATLDLKLKLNEAEKEELKFEYDCQLLKNILLGNHTGAVSLGSHSLKSFSVSHSYLLLSINLDAPLPLEALKDFLAEQKTPLYPVLLTKEHTDNMGFLILFFPKASGYDIRKDTLHYAELLTCFFQGFCIHPFYGISPVHNTLEELHDAFLETTEALNQMTLLPQSDYLFFSDVEEQEISLEWLKLDRFLFLAEAGRQEEMTALFPELFHYFARVPNCRLMDAKNYCMELVEQLKILLPKDVPVNRTSAASLNLLNNLNFIFTFEELQAYFLQFFRNTTALFATAGFYSQKDVTENIKSYIDRHYNMDLNVEFVASLFHLNRSYLSSCFKQRMGVGFVDYINQVRITHSKELLRSTDKKMYQIAQAVGYDNVKYFFRVFKKIEGITPEQYRGAR